MLQLSFTGVAVYNIMKNTGGCHAAGGSAPGSDNC